MKNAIIVFDSLYGNTERVARALSKGLSDSGMVTAELKKPSAVDVTRLSEYDLILVGAPTHAWRPSKKIKQFLGIVPKSALSGKKAFAFDTKMKSRLAGSAAKHIEKALSKLGAEIVRKRESGIVKGTEGPLEAGTEDKFTSIGVEIVKLL